MEHWSWRSALSSTPKVSDFWIHLPRIGGDLQRTIVRSRRRSWSVEFGFLELGRGNIVRKNDLNQKGSQLLLRWKEECMQLPDDGGWGAGPWSLSCEVQGTEGGGWRRYSSLWMESGAGLTLPLVGNGAEGTGLCSVNRTRSGQWTQ